ncbi:MAG TPA: hypothetical protein VGS08_03205 [Candidatus Saccharimonadales bacterium]|nr:hypothetical protein [Candidatus Saccharimonadales bacterium]
MPAALTCQAIRYVFRVVDQSPYFMNKDNAAAAVLHKHVRYL